MNQVTTKGINANNSSVWEIQIEEIVTYVEKEGKLTSSTQVTGALIWRTTESSHIRFKVIGTNVSDVERKLKKAYNERK